MKFANQFSCFRTNIRISPHTHNLDESTPVVKKLHSLENADKISKHLLKYVQPDIMTPAKISAKSCSKNIKFLALEDPNTRLLDTYESESCNFQSASTDNIGSNKGSVDPHMNGT
jgi:hypothetical protein